MIEQASKLPQLGARIENVLGQGIEYVGERVITLDMVDKLHGTKDQASRNFDRYRKQFTEGTHYFCVPYFEWKHWNLTGENGGHRGNKIVLTKRGYALLLKTMDDQLAWDINKHIIESFFLTEETGPVIVDEDGMIDVAAFVRHAKARCGL